MPLCRVGDPGCGCPKKQRIQSVCQTIAIPDKKGNPIAYESCRDKCVSAPEPVGGMPYGTALYPGGPAYGEPVTLYPGGPRRRY